MRTIHHLPKSHFERIKAIFRPGFYGSSEGDGDGGISTQTAIITACVVALVFFLAVAACCLCRRRRRIRSQHPPVPPSLPTHMTQLPPLPPAYVRPITSNDLPAYCPPQPQTNPSAWATPATQYGRTSSSTSTAAVPTQTPRADTSNTRPAPAPVPAPAPGPIATPPGPRRHTIFRRPVPPLHTSDDLAPESASASAARTEPVPQLPPYTRRRGENPFGQRGVDVGLPGVSEDGGLSESAESGDVGLRRSGTGKGKGERMDLPPSYDQAVGRS